MKLKNFYLFTIFSLLFVACGGQTNSSVPTARPTKAWYDGGTLHDKTAADWIGATDANKLATAGDWVTVITTYKDFNEAKGLAKDMVECIDGAVDAAPETMKASEIGLSCAILMGWELK